MALYDKDSKLWVIMVILLLLVVIMIVFLLSSGRMSATTLILLFVVTASAIPYIFLNDAATAIYSILFGILLVFFLSLGYRRSRDKWMTGLLILVVVLFTIISSTVLLIQEQRRYGLWPELDH